ncbi:cytochrome c [Neisseria sp.]|uniref:c-type cytochrome n=1 Tax=Neisseria sp. TaxID=192066 RepID=UPI0028A07927|nr:cytochrome c [Neisseria sp.]
MNKSITTLCSLAALTLLAACGGQQNSNTPPQARNASSVAAASAPVAATATFKPKEAVEERERLMKSFKKDFGTIGKMLKGETPYDAAAFQAAADSLDANAGKPWAYYTAESANEESEAKAEIWSKPDEFKKEIEKFTAATAALKVAAAAGNLESVKKPAGEVGQSCKSCHDAFRAD